MALKTIHPETGRAALGSLLRERSPLGPLKVMAKHLGRFFQIPLPMFHPFVVYGPEANRKVLVTERDKVLWRNTDPVTERCLRGLRTGKTYRSIRLRTEPVQLRLGGRGSTIAPLLECKLEFSPDDAGCRSRPAPALRSLRQAAARPHRLQPLGKGPPGGRARHDRPRGGTAAHPRLA